MRQLCLCFVLLVCFFAQARAVEDTTVTIGDSAQMTVVDSVEIDPGLKMDSIVPKACKMARRVRK